MSGRYAITGARIFDGEQWHDDAALVVSGDGGRGHRAAARASRPGWPSSRPTAACLCRASSTCRSMAAAGVMLNDRPDVETIRTICAAHAPFGTTALLPTLITDTPEITAATVAAGVEAARRKVPGFLGLHLEGPHLSVSRKGAHDPALIRPMNDADEAALIAARGKTAGAADDGGAGDRRRPSRSRRSPQAGVVVSLGHSDASYRRRRRRRRQPARRWSRISSTP